MVPDVFTVQTICGDGPSLILLSDYVVSPSVNLFTTLIYDDAPSTFSNHPISLYLLHSRYPVREHRRTWPSRQLQTRPKCLTRFYANLSMAAAAGPTTAIDPVIRHVRLTSISATSASSRCSRRVMLPKTSAMSALVARCYRLLPACSFVPITSPSLLRQRVSARRVPDQPPGRSSA